MPTTHAETINADLLAFFKGARVRRLTSNIALIASNVRLTKASGFSRAPSPIQLSPPTRIAPVAIMATSRAFSRSDLRPERCASAFRQGPLELLVFELVARVQRGIVALEPRHRAAASVGSIRLTAAAIAFSAAVSMDSSAGRATISATSAARGVLLPGGDHVLLGGEVMEEAAARHVRRGRDVVDGRGLEAALQKQRHRRARQPLAGLLPLALAQARRGRAGFSSGGNGVGAFAMCSKPSNSFTSCKVALSAHLDRSRGSFAPR